MCFLYKCVISNVRSNFFLIFGLFLGVALSSFISEIIQNHCVFTSDSEHVLVDKRLAILRNDDYEPIINLAGKPLKAQKIPKDFQRPRYYKTELGIRDKLLAAILTSPQTIKNYGSAFNKTTNHIFDKIVFFMESESRKSKSDIKVDGVVQFSDTRLVLKPFHVLKYVIDNFLDDYDFFLLIRDKTYIRARELYNLVQKISVSEPVHAGSEKKDSKNNFCSLNSGILLSNTVLQKVALKLDWCIKNAFFNSDDDNIGRCIVYSSGMGCSNKVQGLSLSSFNLNGSFMENEFEKMKRTKKFNEAVTYWPVSNPEMLIKLHAHFSKIDILKKKKQISAVRNEITGQPVVLPDNSTVKLSWPIGTPPSFKPSNRFDLLKWDYFTEEQIYLKTDYSNVEDLYGADRIDVKYILNTSVEYILQKYNNELHFSGLLNGYRKFDPSRGMDYILDLSFKIGLTGREVHKRVEICKPLGKVELIPMPYVTENTRVNMVTVVDESNRKDVLKFMDNYAAVCMEKKDKTFLMLILMYGPQNPGKGSKDDIFAEIKKTAIKYSDRFRRDNNKIAWLSVKLPDEDVLNPVLSPKENRIGLNSGILQIAVLDLVVKKFVSDNLILYCSSNMEIRQDFLNRVRMNTIKDHQVFSPVPFSEFDPNIVYSEDLPRPKELDINRNYGHYDTYNSEHISFYVKDYRQARKTIEDFIPIIHSDKDITELIFHLKKKFDKIVLQKRANVNWSGDFSDPAFENLRQLSINSVYRMFAGYETVHVLRAVEPGLRLRHKMSDCDEILNGNDFLKSSLYKNCVERRNFNSGPRSQLGNFILEFMHGCNG